MANPFSFGKKVFSFVSVKFFQEKNKKKNFFRKAVLGFRLKAENGDFVCRSKNAVERKRQLLAKFYGQNWRKRQRIFFSQFRSSLVVKRFP
jgi:hypothetical protein